MWEVNKYAQKKYQPRALIRLSKKLVQKKI